MMMLLSAIAWIATVIVIIPSAMLVAELCVAARVARRRVATEKSMPGTGVTGSAAPTTAILVPAHNESAGIGRTLQAIRDEQARMPGHATLWVVADNCTDDTAERARSLGARVVERHDDANRGKGHALDAGVRAIGAESAVPDQIVIIDADCVPAPGFIEALTRCSHELQRPVQGRYLMTNSPATALVTPSWSIDDSAAGRTSAIDSPAGAQPATAPRPLPSIGPKQRVSEFAFRLKNWARPLGLESMGWPVPLQGTGMAIPWAQIRDLPLASSNIVEDMAMGIALTGRGTAPHFMTGTLIASEFPTTDAGREKQRRRWEHGHMQTILIAVPALLAAALRARRLNPVRMALDLSIPPLSLLVALQVGVWAVTGLTGLATGSIVPWLLASATLVLTALALTLAWKQFGRDLLPPHELSALLRYALGKLPLYAGYARARHQEWNRGERAGDDQRATDDPAAKPPNAGKP